MLAACATGSSLRVGARDRNYHLHLPAHPPSGRYPLVIALHGGGSNGRQMARTGFDALADREGFAVVYPDAIDRRWNDGRIDLVDPAHGDDVAYMRALIDELVAKYPIDPARVFATGISNGGFMSYRLACELSDKIAAVAPVVGDLAAPVAHVCHPARPVSVLAIESTDDPFVPWRGGQVHVFHDRGEGLGAVASAEHLAGADGCAAEPTIEREPDRAPDDGTSVQRVAWSGCTGGAAVELLNIEGGGHTWPGGSQYLPQALIGRVSREFDATERIWQFFDTHGR